MNITAFDSNVLIYFLEYDEDFGVAASASFAQAIKDGKATLSVVAAAEFFAYKHTPEQIAKYDQLKRMVDFVTVNEEIARTAGKLRLQIPAIKLPDALHLATAIAGRADCFITNDQQLLRLREVDGLKIKPLA